MARAAAHVTYPARFQLVAAMNPCRCGYLGDAARECRRAPACGEDYLGKLSGPLLDRIDIVVHVEPVPPAELSRVPQGENTATVAARVAQARQLQGERTGLIRNAQAPAETVELEDEARELAERASERMRLSARGFTRLLRVGRSIADLAGARQVSRRHVAEALSFRHRLAAWAG